MTEALESADGPVTASGVLSAPEVGPGGSDGSEGLLRLDEGKMERIRGMVEKGKTNLSIAIALGVSIKKVIEAVAEMEDPRMDRQKARFDKEFGYVVGGLPDRKSTRWTTGERAAVLESDVPLSYMAERLGRSYESVKAYRSLARKAQRASK